GRQHIRPRGIAERRAERDVFPIRELGHVVQAAAPDDANLCGCGHKGVWTWTAKRRESLRPAHQRLDVTPALLLSEQAGCQGRIVLEEDNVLPPDGLRQPALLGGERLHRI